MSRESRNLAGPQLTHGPAETGEGANQQAAKWLTIGRDSSGWLEWVANSKWSAYLAGQNGLKSWHPLGAYLGPEEQTQVNISEQLCQLSIKRPASRHNKLVHRPAIGMIEHLDLLSLFADRSRLLIGECQSSARKRGLANQISTTPDTRLELKRRESFSKIMPSGTRMLTSALIFLWISSVAMDLGSHRSSSLAMAADPTAKPQGLNRELEKQIVDKILGEGYDKRIRPSGINNKTGQNDGPAVVRVNTLLRSISKIDDVTMEYSVQLTLRQEWVDERLAFHKMASYNKNSNINSITLTEQERLWKPDLFFRNEKEGHFHKIIMPNVLLRINGDGAVLYSIRISLVLACPMDLKYYPLDKQNCTIEMASYGYLDTDLTFIWKEKGPVQINQPLTLPRFTLETFATAYCTSRTSTGSYSCLRVDLIFKREFSYYLIQIYIPCCMLVIVSWVSFWLDPNAIPARVSLGVTTLLTMATQISGINASLPPVSYTKAIDVWTGVCLTFVFGALLEFALVNYASRSDAHARMQQARQEEELRARELEYQQRQQLAAVLAQQHHQHQHQLTGAGHQHQHQHQYAGQQYTIYGGQPQYTGTQKLPLNRSADPYGNRDGNGIKANGVQQQPTGNQQQQQGYTIVGDQPAADQTKHLVSNGGLAAINSFPFGKQCEIHHSVLQPAAGGRGAQSTGANREAGQLAGKQKKVNFCRAWLNKFPSRSKRIDVISRIFFPKMFAFFNLVYWTTYLFREEDIVQS